jgi:hypothetical protein
MNTKSRRIVPTPHGRMSSWTLALAIAGIGIAASLFVRVF